jgi:hypothetical protein
MSDLQTLIARAREISEAATKTPWPRLYGSGPDEDVGTFMSGAVGPTHTYLLNDEWEYEDPKPTVLSEEEATKRAAADQAAIVLQRNTFDALLDVAESADNLCKATNPILDDDLVFIQRARIATHKHLTALTAALTAAIGENE